MRERRDGLRFAFETREGVGVRGDGLRKDLDRDVPIQLPVPRPVHFAHPSRAERREDLVRAETSPGWKCHRAVARAILDEAMRGGIGDMSHPAVNASADPVSA